MIIFCQNFINGTARHQSISKIVEYACLNVGER